MNENKYSLILGSKSPRRKELLGWLDIPFQIMVSDIAEESQAQTSRDIAQDIASQKGWDIYRKCEQSEGFGKDFFPLIVSADTIVCLGNEIFGKPRDRQHARGMLRKLSGRSHQVITGVWLGRLDREESILKERVFSCETRVVFREIDDDILERYLDFGESMDKAGAYGIQGKSLSFIGYLEGSYSNVVGFPLDAFISELKCFLGYDHDLVGNWRKLFTL